MIFKDQISQILAINSRVNKSTVRFDKGSPSPQIFSLTERKVNEELNKILEGNINVHPINFYKPLIDQIINIEEETSGWILTKDQITISSGVLSGLFYVLPLLLNKGDKVIINDLCFEGITSILNTLQLTPVIVNYENKLELEKSLKNSNVKVLILNSPENPSGKIYCVDFLIYLGYLAKKYNLLIISDEVNNQKIYFPYKFIAPGQYIPLDNLIVLNSFTKNYFLPGIRLGWVASNQEIVKKIKNLITVSQVGISCASQITASYLINNFDKEIDDYKEILFNKKLLMEYSLKKNNLNYLNPVMAGSVIFVRVNKDSQKLTDLLLEKYNIGVIPGSLFGNKWNQWIRLGFGAVSDEQIVKGIKIISQINI